MSDWVLLFGSVILIGACIAVVAFASNSYSKSKVLAGAVLTSEPWAPVELVCGMRIGLMMASWPGGRFRLGPDSVAFDCSGRRLQVAWSKVQLVELVRPLVPPIGWGLRFNLSGTNTRTVVVGGFRRALAERLIEMCGARGAPTDRGAHFVL
jgi:hypothetical protein